MWKTPLKNADTALHRAKEMGRDNFHFYAQDMHDRALDRLMLEQDLRRALERGDPELHYQPQLDLRRYRIIGVLKPCCAGGTPNGTESAECCSCSLAEESGLIEIIG